MTDHPCKGMSKSAHRAFDRIAIGEHPYAAKPTIKALIDNGLIERGEDQYLGHDRLGAITIPSYSVPIAVHIQWCSWCSEKWKGKPTP